MNATVNTDRASWKESPGMRKSENRSALQQEETKESGHLAIGTFLQPSEPCLVCSRRVFFSFSQCVCACIIIFLFVRNKLLSSLLVVAMTMHTQCDQMMFFLDLKLVRPAVFLFSNSWRTCVRACVCVCASYIICLRFFLSLSTSLPAWHS